VPLVALSDPIRAIAVSRTSPGYDVVLLAHVLVAVVGLAALLVAAGSALALRSVVLRGAPVPESLTRYYRPGVNWAGRTLFLVPVLGVALLAMSGGRWDLADSWVSIGMGGWAVVAVAAEAVLWPDERRLQEVVAAVASGDRSTGGGRSTGEAVEERDDRDPDTAAAPGLCLRVGLLGLGLGAVLVAVAVLMVVKP
jgi:hypothetical protein